MKRFLMSVILMLGFSIPVFAELEIWDVQIDSMTSKTVTVTSSAYVTVISTTEIWVSTSTTPNPLYKLVYWEARHESNLNMIFASEKAENSATAQPFKKDEIYREEQYKKAVYGKQLADPTQASLTLYVVMGYKKIR